MTEIAFYAHIISMSKEKFTNRIFAYFRSKKTTGAWFKTCYQERDLKMKFGVHQGSKKSLM